MSIRGIIRNKGSHIETAGPEETVKSAVDRMREKRIAALVVTEGASIEGIVTEREIVHALSNYGGVLPSLKVRDVMSKEVVTIDVSDTVKRAMRLMTLKRARHLLVMEEDAIAGIVSIGDIVKNRLEDLELETNVLRDAWIAAH
jgi:CBS domain-containing protein